MLGEFEQLRNFTILSFHNCLVSSSGRHERIIAETRDLNPDIVAMEEIESEYFRSILQFDMSQLEYDCVTHLR